MRILILGGTGDANRLAAAVAARGIDAIYSYAGRTSVPAPQPLPTRTGGFGGATGLAAYIGKERFTHVIDATHPFAADMSRNAVEACVAAGVPLIALERPVWTRQSGDAWIEVSDLASAVATLPDASARVFLAIGRQHLTPFADKSQHTYLFRFVDEPDGDLPFPNRHVLIDRGPFRLDGELALLEAHRIEWLVTRNSGGDGAYAKIIAARMLGVPVIMIGRPSMPDESARTGSLESILAWIDHEARLGA